MLEKFLAWMFFFAVIGMVLCALGGYCPDLDDGPQFGFKIPPYTDSLALTKHSSCGLVSQYYFVFG